MIVISTPTGHIGSKVLAELSKTNQRLRLIVRDASKIPAKLRPETRRQTEIVEGSLDDPKVLEQALTGADTFFYVIPPTNTYSDVDKYYVDFAKPALAVVKAKGVKRLVYVSGTGLGFEKRAGGVSASFLVEEMITALGIDTRILHCGTFMENLFHSVAPIKFKGEFGTTVPADAKMPWVATADIATVAVSLLLDTSWSGNGSVGVLGPEDLSYGQIAGLISEVVGKPVQYNVVPEEAYKAMLIQYGSSKAAAEGLVEIYSSMAKGTFNRIPRTEESTSPTSFQEWCKDVLKPLVS